MIFSLDIDLSDTVDEIASNILDEVDEAIGTVRRLSNEPVRHTEEVDIHDLLARHQAIALVFTIEDVKKLRPHLADGQAWAVLQMFEAAAEDCPDPMHETIIQLADMEYPKHRKAKLAEIGKIVANYDPHGDERENLVDMLTDLLHWCQSFGEPLDEFLATARMHFAEEMKPHMKGAAQ